MKQLYKRPTIEVFPINTGLMQNLTTQIGPGPSPGGGLARPMPFDEDLDENVEDNTSMSDHSLWKEEVM